MEPNSEPHHGWKRWKEKTERGENQYRVPVNPEACWRKKQRRHFGIFPTDKTAEVLLPSGKEAASELLMQSSID